MSKIQGVPRAVYADDGIGLLGFLDNANNLIPVPRQFDGKKWGNVNNAAMKNSALTQHVGSVVISGATTNATWRDVRTVPSRFSQVRAWLFNYDTVNTSVGHKVSFSPSESLANVSRPTQGGAINDTYWVTATWAASGTVTIPAASATYVPGVVVSDWMNVPFLDRTDGGQYPLLYTNWYNPTGRAANQGYQNFQDSGSILYMDKFNGFASNKHFYGVYGSNAGDCVATPSSFTSTTKSGAGVAGIVEVRLASPAWNLAIFGDSTIAGVHADGYCGQFPMTQAALSALNIPISICNIAQSGGTIAQQYQRFTSTISSIAPNIIFWQGWSVNDTNNYAGSMQAALSTLSQVIDASEKNNTYLILRTPTPYNAVGSGALSGAEVTAYNTMYSYILGCASQRVRVVDISALHDPAKPGVWNAAYGYDGYHGNTAAHQYEANILTNIISSL